MAGILKLIKLNVRLINGNSVGIKMSSQYCRNSVAIEIARQIFAQVSAATVEISAELPSARYRS